MNQNDMPVGNLFTFKPSGVLYMTLFFQMKTIGVTLINTLTLPSFIRELQPSV